MQRIFLIRCPKRRVAFELRPDRIEGNTVDNDAPRNSVRFSRRRRVCVEDCPPIRLRKIQANLLNSGRIVEILTQNSRHTEGGKKQ